MSNNTFLFVHILYLSINTIITIIIILSCPFIMESSYVLFVNIIKTNLSVAKILNQFQFDYKFIKL